MILFKIFPKKSLLSLFILVFLGLVFHQALLHQLFFNADANDLQGFDGENIKWNYLKGYLSIENTIFEYNFFQSFMLPLQIILLGSVYNTLKTNYYCYFLGRRACYQSVITKLKLQLSLLNTLSFALILIVIILISKSVGRFDYQGLEYYFPRESLLQFFSRSTWHYLLYYFMAKGFAIFVESYLLFKMIDCYSHFLKSVLTYLLFLWATAPILYSFLPFYLVPMSHIMITSYGNIGPWQLLASYIPCATCLLLLKFKGPYEIL
ncbi:hypothetical protein N1495_07095 [Streptococcus didelphis]|uniref:DUF2705 domain-containing protein n=1 Tax=Streptococcus didelphis TaxID=102886 RepID=A0ABY9LHW4_9STRE|nr:hypothetical protein [Streptococcus didelphis]WMB28492.1 hypothetical protein N1496_02665 [Streptococcus didelphis]WMB29168.1 hypothetical protein N1495_07095 [Streptococcus didelphis]